MSQHARLYDVGVPVVDGVPPEDRVLGCRYGVPGVGVLLLVVHGHVGVVGDDASHQGAAERLHRGALDMRADRGLSGIEHGADDLPAS